MQVRTRYLPGGSRVSDQLTPANLFARQYLKLRKVCVPRGRSAAVIDHDQPAVAPRILGEVDDAVGGRVHRSSAPRADIQTGVESALTRKRIGAIAITAGDLSGQRPLAGHGVLQPLARKIALHAREAGRLQEIVLLDRLVEGGYQRALRGDVIGTF